MKRIFYILLIIPFFSCGKRENYQLLEIPLGSAERLLEDNSIQIYYEDREVSWKEFQNRECLFVTNKDMAHWYERPDLNSPLAGSSQFGECLWFIKSVDTTINRISSSWYVSVQNVTRKIKVNNTDFLAQVQELVYINSKDLGPEKQVMMTMNDLYECNRKDIRKTFSITSLSQDKFYSEPLTDEWIRKSESWAWKVNLKRISLPLKNSSKPLVFQAVEEGGDDDKHFVHFETLHSVNCYLIYCSFWETSEFRLYDYHNGKLKVKTLGYPCISPDKKYMVAFTNNEMWGEIGIQLFQITDNMEFKELKTYYFSHWGPVIEPLEMAWINNTEFKVHVQSFGKHFRVYKEYDYFNPQPQEGYLKFKILL